MGFGNISIWQLLILLLIVVLVFGTKKLRGMGGDLGSAIRDFRKGMNDSDEKDESTAGEKSVSAEESESDDPASAAKNTSDSSETRT